jgi:predicted phage-related endonuclease
MKIHEVTQGTAEWLKLRLGKITGTRLKDLMAKDNLSLVDEMIAENISGLIENTFVSQAMEIGIAREPIARQLYEDTIGIKVSEVGFITSDKFDYVGCSPDGLIKENGVFVGGLEIKCPQIKAHVKYLRQQQIPNEYKYQVYNYFLCADTIQWLDFVSYCPEFKAKPLFIHRITRQEIEQELYILEVQIEKFWKKYNEYLTQILF